MPLPFLRKIISGGQTGADRAALDLALAFGLPHGGWCPKGRWAEDGPIPANYLLDETPTDDPSLRTEWNVRDSDATLIVAHGPLAGGSSLTREFARQLGKPCLALNLWRTPGAEAVELTRSWLLECRPAVLNVAGPRASRDAAIHAAVMELLRELLA